MRVLLFALLAAGCGVGADSMPDWTAAPPICPNDQGCCSGELVIVAEGSGSSVDGGAGAGSVSVGAGGAGGAR
jgi:hypothetical protein